MFKIKWPQEHDDALREWVAQGKTNSEIAYLLNRDFNATYSRNAVIGRASRLGLTSQSGDKGGDTSPKVKRKRKHGLTADEKIKTAARSNLPASYLRAAAPRIICDSPDLAPARDEALAHSIPLIDLAKDSCRWPVDGGLGTPFRFCGAQREQGCSYCSAHRRAALRHAA
jgi:GcrA cell cycle regulator